MGSLSSKECICATRTDIVCLLTTAMHSFSVQSLRNFEKTSLSFLNYTEKQFTLYSYDFYMFSSSMNHLVQKRRGSKYVLRAMLYTAISTSQNRPKTLLGSRRLSEGSTLLGYLYRNLNFHKQIHSLS